jgi:hypothetical protein
LLSVTAGSRIGPFRRVCRSAVDILEQKIEYGGVAVIAQMFEGGAAEPGDQDRDRQAELARLRLLISETGTVPARSTGARREDAGSGTGAEADDADDVPVLAGLRPLLPYGSLRRGSVVAVEDRVRPWTDAPSYLALALAAGATADGAWCGVVGLPAFGIAAAAGLGADLKRMLMLDEPGERWAEAVAVLAGAVDLILVRPPGRPTAEHVRRITARLRKTARQRGAALVVAGGGWPGAGLTLRTTHAVWNGLGDGTGHLTGRRVTVAAEGRGLGGRGRSVELWLPAADGSVKAAGRAEATQPQEPWVPQTPRIDVPSEIREGGEVIRLRSA